MTIDQAMYREINHFRQAKEKESGDVVSVDDQTFNADVHEELAPEAPAAVDAPPAE